MQKPIFRVFVKYNIRNKGAASKGKNGVIDTFALTDNIKTIEKDEEIHNRICYLNKKKLDKVVITITDVEVEDQYGFTTDRF
jgi:predicted transcriptional regulator